MNDDIPNDIRRDALGINKPDPSREEMEAYARQLHKKLWPEGFLSPELNVPIRTVFLIMSDYPGRADSLFELGAELGLWWSNSFANGLVLKITEDELKELEAREKKQSELDDCFRLLFISLADLALQDAVITKMAHDGALAALERWFANNEKE